MHPKIRRRLKIEYNPRWTRRTFSHFVCRRITQYGATPANLQILGCRMLISTMFLSCMQLACQICKPAWDKLTCNAGATASTHGKQYVYSKAAAVAITARPLKYILTRLPFACYRQKFRLVYKTSCHLAPDQNNFCLPWSL